MRTSGALHRALLLILSVLLASTLAAAQAGQLDPTFGTGGIVTTDFSDQTNSNAATANAVTIQTDGKILVCGGVPSNTGFPTAAIARYNTNGSLDTSFGTGGIAVTPKLAPPSSIALQSNGMIVVAGPSGGLEINVARYSSTGTLDPTFGTGGIFTSGLFLGTTGPSNVVIEPDGKILVAEGILLQLLSDGQLDTSFGTEGTARVLGGDTSSLALLANGKILAGFALPAGDFASSGYISRYTSNGNLDPSFGINGQLATAGPANAMHLLSTGQIVVGGSLTTSVTGLTSGFAVSRYMSTGVTDTTFATHGGVVTPIADFTTVLASGLGVQSTGDLVLLGTASTTTQQVFALARYTSTGQLDTTFGTNGTVTTSLGTTSLNAPGLAIQSDDKIVAVAGFTTTEPHGEFDTGFKLVRYLGQ